MLASVSFCPTQELATLLEASAFIVVDMVESTRLRSKGDVPINSDGGARGGENARITPATALPMPLKIAPARLWLASGSTCDVPACLCGLGGAGSRSLDGAPSSIEDGIVQSILRRDQGVFFVF